jgi:hypothetical protein
LAQREAIVSAKVQISLIQHSSVHKEVKHLESIIAKGLQKFIPSHTANIKKSSLPWYDEECQKASEDRDENRINSDDFRKIIADKIKIHLETLKTG